MSESVKQVILRDPKTNEILIPKIIGTLGYEPAEDGTLIPPYSNDADTLNGKTADQFAAADHNHDENYAAKSHDHDTLYAPIVLSGDTVPTTLEHKTWFITNDDQVYIGSKNNIPICVTDDVLMAAMTQNISTEWGSSNTAKTYTYGSSSGITAGDLTIKHDVYTVFVDNDFHIEGTNGYNKRLKIEQHKGPSQNLASAKCHIRCTVTCNGETYTTVLDCDKFISYSWILTIPTTQTLGIVEGHVKCEVMWSDNFTAYDSCTQYNPGCTVYADTYS